MTAPACLLIPFVVLILADLLALYREESANRS